jgi:dolichyl-diphosphooligosaccharide--protein glycosyltransferase
LTFLFPAGIYYCFSKLNDHNIFIILYGITSVYFAGVMVRLMLVLAPVMCILGGIAISASLSSYMKYLEGSGETFLLTIKTFTNVILTRFLLLRFRRINYD